MSGERLEVTLIVDSEAGIAEIKRTGRALDDLGNSSESSGQRAGRALDGMGMKILNVNQLLELSERAFSLLLAPIEKIVGTGAKFENIEKQLSVILQSAEKGKEYFEWIREFSAKTPFQLEGLAETVTLLESFGVDSKKYLETFGDAAAALKIPLNDLGRVMGQIWNKPTAQMEEMLQLIERGVPVARILTEQLGLTADQIANIGKLGIQGKIVFEALAAGMKDYYGGAMANFSITWDGLISTLKDKFNLFMGQTAGPVLENFKEKLKELLNNIDRWAKDGTLEKWGNVIANVITGLIDTLVSFTRYLFEAGKVIATIISYAGGLQTVASTIALVFAVGKIQAFSSAMAGTSIAFAALNANLTGSNALLISHIAITKLGAAAWGMFQKAIPLLVIGAAVKIIKEINDKLNDLKDQNDKVTKSEITHNEVMQASTEKFRSFRDHANLSSETLQKMTQDFSHIEDRGVRYNKIMRAIRDGKYGEKLANEYKIWHEEQKKLLESNNKVINSSFASQLAQEAEKKKLEELIKKLKLTNDLKGDLEEKTRLLLKAIEQTGPEWWKNSQAIKEVGKYTSDLVDGYTTAGLQIPKEIDKIATVIKLAESEQRTWNEELKEADKFFKQHSSSLKSGVEDIENFEDQTSLAAQSLEVAAEMTLTFDGKLQVLGEFLNDVGLLLNQATGALLQFGLISEKTANALSGLGSGLGAVSSGLDSILKDGASVFDILSGGIGVLSGAGSIIGGIISLLSGKSGEMEAAERHLSNITGLSGDWAEKIEKLAQEIGGAESAARAFNASLAEIISTSDRTYSNFNTLITKTREIISVFERGNASAQETAKNFGAAFSEMVTFAQDLGTEGGAAMTGLIMLADEFGLKVKEIENYVSTNMKSAFEGYKKYIEGEFSTVTIGVFEEMRVLQDKIANNQTLVDGVRGLSDSMIGLSNVTRLTEEQYQQFETSALDAYNSLINQGFTADESLQIMQPMIERLAYLQQEFGYNVDDATKALIDQGVEAGLVSENMGSQNQMMIDGFDRIVDRLDRICRGLGVDMPEAFDQLDISSGESFDRISRNTGDWSNQLKNIKDQVYDIADASSDLDDKWYDIMKGHSIIPVTDEWLLILNTVDTTIYGISDTFSILDNEFTLLIRDMGDHVERFAIDSEGNLRTLLHTLALIGQQTQDAIGNRYGVYTEEEKIEMTATMYQMAGLWQNNRATILASEDSMRRFLSDVENLVVIDEAQEVYTRFLTSMRQWYAHLEKGETWDETNKTWKPDITAASGFMTLLEKPTHIMLNGKRILAGEAGPELFSITPLDTISPLQNIPIPVSSKVGHDYDTSSYASYIPGKSGSDTITPLPEKNTEKKDITIKIEGNIQGLYPPLVIPQGANKEQLKSMLDEVIADNYRGLIDDIAYQVKRSLND